MKFNPKKLKEIFLSAHAKILDKKLKEGVQIIKYISVYVRRNIAPYFG